MSLRLRRGTDTERQSVVFSEGELVYTTDSKELYIGDGSTLGGIRITGAVETSPIALTQDLDLNGFDITGGGDVNINGAVIANSFFGDGGGLTNLPLLDVNNGAAYQISIVGSDSSIIVNSDTSELFGDFIGNLKGAVFDSNNNIMVDNVLRTMSGTLNGEFNGTSTGLFVGDDSTVMINGANSTFYGNFSGDASNLTNFPPDVGITEGSNYRVNIVGSDSTVIVDSETNTLTGDLITQTINTGTQLNLTNVQDLGSELFLNLISSDQQSNLRLERKSDSDITADEVGYGRILFTKDDINGKQTTSVISATRSFLFMGNDPTGTFSTDKWFSINDGNFGFGTFSSTEKLTVAGNTVVEGFIQFGSLTSTQRDALTAANGMVIYNTTNNKFEGYQNGAWINLDDGNAAS